jgi:hypothetical protein
VTCRLLASARIGNMSRISIYRRRRRRRRAQICVSYGKYFPETCLSLPILLLFYRQARNQDACNDKDKDNNTNEINVKSQPSHHLLTFPCGSKMVLNIPILQIQPNIPTEEEYVQSKKNNHNYKLPVKQLKCLQ